MFGPVLVAVVVTVAPLPERAGGEGAIDNNEGSALEERELALEEVLSSCENALGEGECRGPDQGGDTWQAAVAFTDSSATVTLSRPNRVIVRNLEFSPEDSEKQRRVAAGLLVAAMTAAARLSEPDVEEETMPPVERQQRGGVEKAAGAPSRVQRSSPTRSNMEPENRTGGFSVEVAGMFGSTLGGPHWGGGGAAAFSLWLRPHLGLGISAGGLYSYKDDWEALKFDGGVGPRMALVPESKVLSWELAVEGVLDFTQVRYAPGRSAPGGALRGGGRMRTSWALGASPVRPFLGVAITSLSPVLEIQRDGTKERVVPAFLGSAFLGIVYKSRR